jgi:hypothetical protein
VGGTNVGQNVFFILSYFCPNIIRRTTLDKNRTKVGQSFCPILAYFVLSTMYVQNRDKIFFQFCPTFVLIPIVRSKIGQSSVKRANGLKEDKITEASLL